MVRVPFFDPCIIRHHPLIAVLGDPWISGTVNIMQGRVDLKFRVKGDKGGSGLLVYSLVFPIRSDDRCRNRLLHLYPLFSARPMEDMYVFLLMTMSI